MVPCRATERFTRPMATNRWRQISELYDAALTKAPENRAAFLADACSDEELRRRSRLAPRADRRHHRAAVPPDWVLSNSVAAGGRWNGRGLPGGRHAPSPEGCAEGSAHGFSRRRHQPPPAPRSARRSGARSSRTSARSSRQVRPTVTASSRCNLSMARRWRRVSAAGRCQSPRQSPRRLKSPVPSPRRTDTASSTGTSSRRTS